MKTIVKTILSLILCFFILIISGKCNAQLKQDKIYHFGAGSGVAISTHLILRGDNINPFSGTLFSMSVGTFKEAYDVNNGGRFSFADIGATLIGGMVVDGFVFFIKKKRKRKNVRKQLVKL